MNNVIPIRRLKQFSATARGFGEVVPIKKEQECAANYGSVEWLDINHVASRLKRSRNAVYILVRRRRLRFYRTIDNRLMFSSADVDRYARGQLA